MLYYKTNPNILEHVIRGLWVCSFHTLESHYRDVRGNYVILHHTY